MLSDHGSVPHHRFHGGMISRGAQSAEGPILPSHSISPHNNSGSALMQEPEDVEVNVDEVIECPTTESRGRCRTDSDGADSSSPLSHHTSTSSSHSTTMSPPREPTGIGRAEPLAKIVRSSHSQCECCHLLKHVAEVSQARCSYLEVYSLGLQAGQESLTASLSRHGHVIPE